MTNTKQSGYTLIELLLYVSIIGSLLIAVSYFYATVVDSRIKNQSISEVNIQGELAVEHIAQTIRNANSINQPTIGMSSTALTLEVPTESLSPTSFNLNETTLEIVEGMSAGIPLTSSKIEVFNLNFINLSQPATPGTIQFTFTVSRTNTSGRNQYDYQKTFTSSATLRTL